MFVTHVDNREGLATLGVGRHRMGWTVVELRVLVQGGLGPVGVHGGIQGLVLQAELGRVLFREGV